MTDLRDHSQPCEHGRVVSHGYAIHETSCFGGRVVTMCEHGYAREHLVDYWWQNTSNAGAEWCDGVIGGQRVENVSEVRAGWNEKLQQLDWWAPVAAGDTG